jgi:hypothetical protein
MLVSRRPLANCSLIKLAAIAARVQVLQDTLQGVVMHRGGCYPKAEQRSHPTKKKSAKNGNSSQASFYYYYY